MMNGFHAPIVALSCEGNGHPVKLTIYEGEKKAEVSLKWDEAFILAGRIIKFAEVSR